MSNPPRREAYRIHGMMQSYFTRKVTGYYDYKGIPWLLRRFPGVSAESVAAGFPGGVPLIETPEHDYLWDSTQVILHLETRFPEPSVLPEDPLLRFLAYVIEDMSDEWLYRPAVGSRWFFDANASVAGFELARDITVKMPVPCHQAFAGVGAHVRSSCGPLGVDDGNIQNWIDEVLRPWQRTLGAHLTDRRYLFGDRPSLADFALFGGNAAHFINDPLCRGWTDEDAPAVVQHTHRLLEPEDQSFDGWSTEVADSLVTLLADLGRLYLPWVSRACAEGVAEIRFADGRTASVHSTPFLREARATLLARYVELRHAALDRVLEAAGILPYFADFTADAGTIPDPTIPPKPPLNRPFPPEGE